MIALFLVGLAATATPDLRFEWVRAPSAAACPDRRAVLAAAAETLGALPLSDSSSVAVEGLATCTATSCAARLVLFDAAGQPAGDRQLETPRADCEGLVERVVLALSLLSGQPLFERPVRAPKVVAPQPPPSRLAISAGRADPVWHTRAAVSLRALIFDGVLPGGAGAGISAAVSSPSLSIFDFGGGVLYLPQQRDDALGIALSAAWLEGCGGAGIFEQRAELGACARFYLGASHVAVESNDFLRSTGSGVYLWSSAGVAARGRVSLWGPIYGVVEGELLVAITRRPFEVANRPDLSFRESQLSWITSVGAGASF